MERACRKHIPSVLKKSRKSNRLTQSELAAKVGVTRWEIIQWEKGKSMPGGDNMLMLGLILHDNPMVFYYEYLPELRRRIALNEQRASLPKTKKSEKKYTRSTR